ncbi:MAG TPA: serine hydrolase [Bacillota bacterium]|nr:serine hydrolase [Bacillota bacterium]
MLEGVFAEAGCEGFLVAKRLGGPGAAVALAGDSPVALASVFKIAVALAFERLVAAGELDPATRVHLLPETRTPGPTGLSVCADPAELSARDLAYFMMSLSDNAATDALIDLVGLPRISAVLREIGLTQTVIPDRMADELDAVGAELGFADWRNLTRAQEGELGEAARAKSIDKAAIARSKPVDPDRGWRGTAREMAQLIEAIWLDRAGPPAACDRVRWLMSHQGKSRIAAAMPEGTRAWAKSGSLFGIWRNEAGVVKLPEGAPFVVAVFTRAHVPFARGGEIEVAIGKACRLAVDAVMAPA